MTGRPANILSVLKAAALDWWNDNALRLAASLSYYTALSIAPLLVIVVAIAGLVLGREAVTGQLTAQMGDLMGEDGKQIVQTVLEHAAEPKRGAIAGVLGVLTLILGATAVFGELQSAMNLIWEVKPKPTEGLVGGIWAWLRQRVLSLSMVLVIAFLLLVSLVLSAALTGLTARLHGGAQAQAVVAQVLNQLVSIPVLTLLFALLFKYLPDAEIRWRDVWIGALVSAILFTIGKYAIGLYLGHAGVGSAYGAAGSLVVLLVWVYYSSLLLFFGAEFTQAFANRNRKVKPKDFAEEGPPVTKKSEA